MRPTRDQISELIELWYQRWPGKSMENYHGEDDEHNDLIHAAHITLADLLSCLIGNCDRIG